MKQLKNLPVFLVICVVLFLTACKDDGKAASDQHENKIETEVTFLTSDSLLIYGDYYPGDKNKATVLLCHQGGSNARGEYSTIIDSLQDHGFAVLAIDLRTGGQLYGSWNRTIAEFSKPVSSYCDAYADIVAAVKFIKDAKKSNRIILWGSSFSASLGIKFAAENSEDVMAVLAFSPASGEPMQNCMPEPFFETITVPLLILRPAREMEIESVKNQIAKAEQYKQQTYIAENGVHGSSMLVEERTGHEINSTWYKVITFIKSIE